MTTHWRDTQEMLRYGIRSILGMALPWQKARMLIPSQTLKKKFTDYIERIMRRTALRFMWRAMPVGIQPINLMQEGLGHLEETIILLCAHRR